MKKQQYTQKYGRYTITVERFEKPRNHYGTGGYSSSFSYQIDGTSISKHGFHTAGAAFKAALKMVNPN